MGIKLTGVRELQKKLKQNATLDDVKQVVKHNGSELQTKAQRNAPVDTGNLKRSIGLGIRDSGMTAEVEPAAEYAPYVEFGTRFMNAQPFVGPAFHEQEEKFRKDLKKLVE